MSHHPYDTASGTILLGFALAAVLVTLVRIFFG